MYCAKCGKYNSDDAAYCQKCGVLIEAEEETRVAVRGNAPVAELHEQQIFSITPTLKFVKVGYAVAVLAAIIAVALMSILFPVISPWYVVLPGMLLLLVPAYFHFSHKLVRYTLTDSKIEIDSGLISRTTRNIPIDRIQDVTVTATIPQRLLGFGNVVIDNASEDGDKLVLKNIDSPKQHADLLLKQMRKRSSV